MCNILEHRRLNRKLGKLATEILKRYEKWKDIVPLSGSAGLKEIKRFHDESLSGEWRSHCSSRLGLQYRISYRVKKQEIVVEVVNPTAHDYKRK